MHETETAQRRSGDTLERKELLIDVAELRHFEILALLQSRSGDDETVGPGRQSVADIARQADLILCIDVGVAPGDWVASGEIRGQRAIQVLIRVRLEKHGVDEVAKSIHVR